MSIVRILLQFILLALSSLGIAALMEWYKKTIRKDKATTLEIRIIAAVASAITAVIFKFVGLFTPIISAIFPEITAWIDVVLYTVIIYLLQLFGDMGMIKNAIKYVTNRLLESNDMTKEIKNMIADFESASGFDAKEIATALVLIGITEEKVKTVLKEVGLSEEKANELIEAYKEAIAKEAIAAEARETLPQK